MKKLQFVVFGAFLAFCVACGDKGGASRTDGGGAGTDGGGGNDGGGGGVIQVLIERPTTGDSFAPTDTITFIGSATDTRTSTPIANAALVWSSQLVNQIGIGAQIRTGLPEGTHTITLTATADDGTTGSASITLTVAVPPLDVQIRNPNNRDIFPTGQTITFDCRVRLAGAPVPAADIRWTSDLSNQIGIGAQIRTAISDGTHVITCTATDPATGDSGSDSIRITVGEPAIRIRNPGDGSLFAFGDTITFDAQIIASDPAATVTWSSDQDGQIGVGPNIRTQLATAGTHVIRATVSALVGGSTATATDQITIDYVRPNQVPVVTITDPATDGTTVVEGSTITFVGTAIDAEDGDLTTTATWRSASNGLTGAGGAFTLSNVAAGKIEVTLEATDSAGATGRDIRVVYVDPATGPLVTTAQNGNRVNGWASDAAARGSWAAVDQQLVFTDTVGATTTYQRPDLGLGGGNTRINDVTSATGTTSGDLVIVSTDKGLSICTGPASTLSCTGYGNAIDNALGTTKVSSAVVIGDTVIAATDNGIFVVDTATGNTRAFDGGDWGGNDRVNDVASDGTRAWLATDSGLVSYDPFNDTFVSIPNTGLPNTQLDSVAVGPSGEVWVAFDGGIARLDGTPGNYSWSVYGANQGLTEPAVLDIAVDSNGVVWGGTDGGGAFRFDPSAESFLMITTADGLPSNVVESVTIGPYGEKVFGTRQGVATWYGN